MIEQKKKEAGKSIIVQVNSENSYQELYNFCSQFGEIKKSFHYQIAEEQSHYILLEYSELSGYQDALNKSQFNPENPGVPVKSPFLWFKALNTKKAQYKSNREPPLLKCDQKVKLLDESSLNEVLTSAKSIEEQMKMLHSASSLDEFGMRIRFILAKQLEQVC
jgi:poly(A) RNA polymerase, mitochondrial